MNPDTPISSLPNIGPYYSRKLKTLEIETVGDLIYHFPFRYDDFTKSLEELTLSDGEKVSFQGTVWQIKNIRTRTGKFLTVAKVAGNNQVIDVVWFNQSYLTKNIKAGTPISLSGKVKIEFGKPKLISPSYEIIRGQLPANGDQGPETVHTTGLVPIYPETQGISSKWLRTRIKNLLPLYIHRLEDFIPAEIISRQKLERLETALTKIHFPKEYEDVNVARKRLAFDEIFTTQLLSIMRKKSWQEERKAPQITIGEKLIADFKKSLPFTLTSAQNKAADEILSDINKQIPMNRLLEGDVGSGKTVVAAAAALVAAKNNFEIIIAAPTEILTFQHQKTLEDILKPFGISVGIWTASKKQKGQITCGTHALLSSYSSNKPIGLVVVDEQHRFGVAQRAKLFMEHAQKLTPHLLTMTATPIPRTLALTLYGDLDLSILDEMPKGRQKIATFVVPNRKREEAYKFIEKNVADGHQAFIITPFVEPSESMVTVKAAKVEFEKLKKKFSKKTKLGLLHGRLKSKEKEKVINDFKKNKINILVSTPVVEVGIDVPNATIIMIESAERFGLAQLHQLRGRVGRGVHKSYCFLFSDSNREQSITRLKSMEKVHVGFELAEIDLKMRGSGEIFGLKQSGFTNFKIADISDYQTIKSAQTEAKNLLEMDPKLKNHNLLQQKLESISSQYSQPN